MRIVQISDSHISREHPDRLVDFERCVSAINGLDPRIDAVVHTGDVAHNGLPAEYDDARQAMERLNVPFFVLAGNRDDRAGLIGAFADGRHIRPGIEFIQYAVEDFPVRIIAADTVSTESNKGRFDRSRLDHLNQLLAADRNRPTALFLHHPPFPVHVGPDLLHFENESEMAAIQSLILANGQVQGIYCGHVHRAFETQVGEIPAVVISSVSYGVRWDKDAQPPRGTPLFLIHDFSGAATAPELAVTGANG